MNNLNIKHTRHPKGHFAMAIVFSFTGAAILASIIFSLLLFLSIDKNPLMMVLFGALAVIFELGKFFAWYEFGERAARRNYPAATSALTFYAILAAISIGGSVGGINSATNTAQKYVNASENRVNVFNLQIEAIQKEIDLNNIAAAKYIELNRITIGVTRIQKENSLLRKQQVDLATKRDNLPITNEGSVFGLIGGLAKTFKTDPISAQLGLVVFLALLLDVFAAFFVGLIGEELRFKRDFKKTNELLPTQNIKNTGQDEEKKQSAEECSESTQLFQKTIDLLNTGNIRCSKKAISTALSITDDEVTDIFNVLLEKGFVNKKANHHFNWLGNT